MAANSLWEVRVRDVGEHVVKNFRFGSIIPFMSRMVHNYRATYITCKNARMLPFWHLVGVCMLVNYVIDYRHLKHERLRKYH